MHLKKYALHHLQAANQLDALEVQVSSASGLQAISDLHTYAVYNSDWFVTFSLGTGFETHALTTQLMFCCQTLKVNTNTQLPF